MDLRKYEIGTVARYQAVYGKPEERMEIPTRSELPAPPSSPNEELEALLPLLPTSEWLTVDAVEVLVWKHSQQPTSTPLLASAILAVSLVEPEATLKVGSYLIPVEGSPLPESWLDYFYQVARQYHEKQQQDEPSDDDEDEEEEGTPVSESEDNPQPPSDLVDDVKDPSSDQFGALQASQVLKHLLAFHRHLQASVMPRRDPPTWDWVPGGMGTAHFASPTPSSAQETTPVNEDALEPSLALVQALRRPPTPHIQDLELKGLHRKAAAAAYEASVSSPERQTLGPALEALQWVLRNRVMQSWGSLEAQSCVKEFRPVLEDLLQSEDSTLQQAALQVWVECVPHWYTTHAERVELLESLLVEEDPKRLKLWARRLRVADLLEGFVNRPAVVDQPVPEQGPQLVTPLMLRLYRALEKSPCAELEELFHAICHRCHARMILFDGLYNLRDGIPSPVKSLAASRALVTGDTVYVGANHSPNLLFDPMKCADSIAMISGFGEGSGGSGSVHQRASKDWGTALSSRCFNPRTGVHRWAVRLDKCERGHVFVGVATSQASMRTYVGGDKYGWGMIGTQALWHDRRKLRGDYGAIFRTGSTIIVTLDTDAGTLSFSSWKDASQLPSSDPLSVASPRRQGAVAGTVDDWGVAFEGLPLDSRLYPAVGLYQRDDRVTLLSVESSSEPGTGSDLLAGECFYPKETADESESSRSQVRGFNDRLSCDTIDYCREVLELYESSLRSAQNDSVLNVLVPSFAAALGLAPGSIPVLSNRFGVALLPLLSRTILSAQTSRDQLSHGEEKLFGPAVKEGEWLCRATSNASRGYDEYILRIKDTVTCEDDTFSFNGDGSGRSGRSKNGAVSVEGISLGSFICFVENWQDDKKESLFTTPSTETSSSCVVSARASVDGSMFEGIYRHVRNGSTGQIVGCCTSSSVTPARSARPRLTSAVMSIAFGHLMSTVAFDAAGDFDSRAPASFDAEAGRKASVSVMLDGLYKACGAFGAQGDLGAHLEYVRRYLTSDGLPLGVLNLSDRILVPSAERSVATSPKSQLEDLVESLDESVSTSSGGLGSLRSLCPDLYDVARKRIVCSIVHLSRRFDDISESSRESSGTSEMIWRSSLRVMEDGARRSLSTSKVGGAKDAMRETCQLFVEAADMLLGLAVDECSPELADVVEGVMAFFAALRSQNDLLLLEEDMGSATRRAILRSFSLVEFTELLGKSAAESPLSLEYLVAALSPFLSGTGVAAGSGPVVANVQSSRFDLPFHATTKGAELGLRVAIDAELIKVLVVVGEILASCVSSTTKAVSGFSVTNSLLAVCLSAAMSGLRLSPSVTSSSVFSSLKKAISQHRHAVMDAPPGECAELQGLVVRDTSRLLLQGCVATAHAHIFECMEEGEHDDDIHRQCMNWLCFELGVSLPHLEHASASTAYRTACSMADDEVERWKLATSPAQRHSDQSRATLRKCETHLEFLTDRDVCLSLVVASTASPTRTHTRSKAVLPTDANDAFHKARGHFFNRHLSQWLHIVSSVVKSSLPEKRGIIIRDKRWLDMLLRAAGLEAKYDEGSKTIARLVLRTRENGCLPPRHRARVLLFLFHILRWSKADAAIAEGLFALAGYHLSSNADDQEIVVAREAVSLLRKLYVPDILPWRDSIGQAIVSSLSSGSFMKRTGVAAFFGGSIDGIAKLSHVIVKPVSSLPAAADQMAVTSKSSSSSGHRLDQAGTQSVVAGILRFDGDAGIVSSIDSKNGTCEVVLVSRSICCDRSKSDASAHPRASLSIRAIRAPLNDVVCAQEYPLAIDNDTPAGEVLGSMLEPALRNVLSALRSESKDDADPVTAEASDAGTEGRPCGDAHAGSKELACDLMCLKCCSTLLADPRVFDLVKDEWPSALVRDVVNSLFSVAWPEASDASAPMNEIFTATMSKSLAALPFHESKFEILRKLVNHTLYRKQIVGDHAGSSLGKIRSGKSDVGRASVPPRSMISEAEAAIVGDKSTGESSGGTGAVNAGRSVSQSSAASSNSDEDEDDEDQTGRASVALSHLHEALVDQMTELGIPRTYAELALRRTGGTNIEAAVHFCLENGAEIERLLAEDMDRESSERASRDRQDGDDELPLTQLLEMGFPRRWCTEALAACAYNVDEALTWILNNNEMLENLGDSDSSGDDDDEDHSSDEEDDSDIDEQSEGSSAAAADPTADSQPRLTKPWTESVSPLRVISGKASINAETFEVSGLQNGGFASVGVKGVLLVTGKWYYEVVLDTAGCIQVGFGDSSFAGHCNAERGDGCGDSSSSFSFDGWRRLRWHAMATEWGCRWKEGDVVGCLLDLDERVLSFTLNGEGEHIGMGEAFSDMEFCGGLFPVVSFNRREKLKLILGGSGEDFRFSPPDGFRGVGEAVLASVQEMEKLMERQGIESVGSRAKSFLCDYSEEEHGHELFSWSHRYYGADASVHLGPGRVKQVPAKYVSVVGDQVPSAHLERRLDRMWARVSQVTGIQDEDASSLVDEGYDKVLDELVYESLTQSMTIAVLLARKIVLHLLVSGANFGTDILSSNKLMGSLTSIVENCVTMRSWAGEAGTMAMAAETLGLGIQMQTKPSVEQSGMLIPFCGASQSLGSVLLPSPTSRNLYTNSSFVACAELAFCNDGGGALLSFLRDSLVKAAASSDVLRESLLVAVMHSMHALSIVEETDGDSAEVGFGALFSTRCDGLTRSYQDDDDIHRLGSAIPDDSTDPGSKGGSGKRSSDARLASFFTGVLLSRPVLCATADVELLCSRLLAGWILGILSASQPWRMISCFTMSAIIESCPAALGRAVSESPTLQRVLGRLNSIAARRIWAERAASPVSSRYTQGLIELIASIRSAAGPTRLPFSSGELWSTFAVDASSPRPLEAAVAQGSHVDWESDGGWIQSGDVWTGSLHLEEVKWQKPSRSAVRTLMEGGDGPPLLRPGCTVLRGPDWISSEHGSRDGQDQYEEAKLKRKMEVSEMETQLRDQTDTEETDPGSEKSKAEMEDHDDCDRENQEKTSTKKRHPTPKLAVGIVLAIEPWNGVPALGRRVRWYLTGHEEVYRFGGDGGRYDIVHVEVNSKQTKVTKRHPLPESTEQCVSRHGFGNENSFSVLLRLPKLTEEKPQRFGVMELPDFGAGVKVSCTVGAGDSVSIEECGLLYGSRDSGWEARFGRPAFLCGMKFVLRAHDESQPHRHGNHDDDSLEALVGTCQLDVPWLRDCATGQPVSVSQTLRIQRCLPSQNPGLRQAPPPGLTFDPKFHASSLAVSHDCRTVTCTASDGRGSAFGSLGFSKGIHYWEVILEQADIGSVFIGCAEKPHGDGALRLNRWHGWGFVNFRATYSNGSERVYGVHAHAGDVVGVLLDCDAGRLSFFYDGMKYGEHILNDLGCAFENLSPFGFSAQGCGTGGSGQSSQTGFARASAQGYVRPRTLWPVVGLRNQGDRVTIKPLWSTTFGPDGVSTLRNVIQVTDSLVHYEKQARFPDHVVDDAFQEFRRWKTGNTSRIRTRGSGSTLVELDTSPLGCAAASAFLGLDVALLPGDHVRLKRSSGRALELSEEAVVLGHHQLRLFYKVVSQKNEGQSLAEGASLPHWFEECDMVDGVEFLSSPRGRSISLPRTSAFRCPFNHALRVVYEGGALVRSDLEINDQSRTLGNIPVDTVIPHENIVERRHNSCGVLRYRVRHGDMDGYISASLRGGNEETVVEIFPSPETSTPSETSEECIRGPYESASIWLDSWGDDPKELSSEMLVEDESHFRRLAEDGIIPSLSVVASDAALVRAMNAISVFAEDGDTLSCSFWDVYSALKFCCCREQESIAVEDEKMALCHAAAAALAPYSALPPLESMMARVALLRVFNRRAQYALPWLSSRPYQEGSSILGGLHGFGALPDKAGRTSFPDAYKEEWLSVPSIGSRLRYMRSVLFTSVKRGYLDSVTLATTTPTPLSQDEYELPREIRTVRINRLKAARAMAGSDSLSKRKYSVFAQLHNETKSWGGTALRRGYIAKGHGGQRRAFKVKFVGEGVNDYSGPYREAFTDAFAEITKTGPHGHGVLGILDETPNKATGIGDDRELLMFSLNGKDMASIAARCTPSPGLDPRELMLRDCFASMLLPRDEASREVEEALVFLGRLVGTAYRHGIAVDLPLPMLTMWKALVEELSGVSATDRLAEIDILAARQAAESKDPSPLLLWQQRLLNSFVEGLSSVIPFELLSLMTGEELREILCGNPSVDVELLQRVAEYEGYEATDEVIRNFWDILREFDNEDRQAFLQFVWARKRLPMREADLEAPLKIQRDSANVGERADLALPSASTCFFSLTLPAYSSAEILREKLLFAIHNVTTMETDFQTNSAEIAEGYR